VKKMGYTHYWYREREINRETYKKIVEDFKKLIPTLRVLDIKLGDGFGENEPIITDNEVYFNGLRNCGHKKNGHLVLPWPSSKTKFGTAPNTEVAIDGNWWAGVTLNQRACDGDCSYETFGFPRTVEREHIIGEIAYRKMSGEVVYNEPKKVGKYFNCCKTAFRPYDLAVNIFLIITKHYLGEKILVSSDGDFQHWIDGAKICQNAFGYGLEDFQLD